MVIAKNTGILTNDLSWILSQQPAPITYDVNEPSLFSVSAQMSFQMTEIQANIRTELFDSQNDKR